MKKSDMVAELQYQQWLSRADLVKTYNKYMEDKETWLTDLKTAYIKYDTIHQLVEKVLDDKDYLKAIEEYPISCELEMQIISEINGNKDNIIRFGK